MKIKCKKCGYVWDYKGSLIYAGCPSCITKNKVSENTIEDIKTDVMM